MRTALVAAFVLAACADPRAPTGPMCPDADGDGHLALPCGDDCDDGDPQVHPGALELCTGNKDENCDGHVNEGCACVPGHTRACYPGPPGTETVGACHPGTETCAAEGRWGDCQGAVQPSPEPASCDGIDQDCNGKDDGACGCEVGGQEICGNGLDDDCNGVIDDPSSCPFSCLTVSRIDPPAELACCSTDPPARLLPTCMEIAGMPPCSERACLASAPLLTCVRVCDGGDCQCQLSTPGGPQPDARCGFETPCARLGCEERQHQPCYTGPPATSGKGVCLGGFTSCHDGVWDICDGQVLPGMEVCGNHLDDDCDGLIDEEDGTTGKSCPPEGICDEVETCGDGKDSDCNGKGGPGQPEDSGCCTPSVEICNGKDDDCDGLIDEGLIGTCGSCDHPCVDLSLQGDCSAPGRTCQGTGFQEGTVRVDGPPPQPSHALTGTTYDGDLVRLDTRTGEETLRLPGRGVGQVALSIDGTMWLWDGATLLHLDPTGSVLCTLEAAPLPGELDLGMRLDASGNPWLFIGVMQQSGGLVRLRRVHHSVVKADAADVPACVLIDGAPIEVGANMGDVYAAGAFDGAGRLWLPATRIIMRLDTASMKTASYLTPEEPRMAVVDESDRFYVAGPSAIDRIEPIPVSFRIDGVTALTTLGGSLWAVEGESGGFSFVEVDALSGVQLSHVRVDQGPGPRNVAVDDEDRLWTLSTDLHRFDTAAGSWRAFAGERLYVTATSTDTELRRRASRVATLQQVLDSGSVRTSWRSATFDSSLPAGSNLALTLRFSDSADDLATSLRSCGPYNKSPADLHGCPEAAGRYVLAEVVVYATSAGDSATVSNLRVLGDLH